MNKQTRLHADRASDRHRDHRHPGRDRDPEPAERGAARQAEADHDGHAGSRDGGRGLSRGQQRLSRCYLRERPLHGVRHHARHDSSFSNLSPTYISAAAVPRRLGSVPRLQPRTTVHVSTTSGATAGTARTTASSPAARRRTSTTTSSSRNGTFVQWPEGISTVDVPLRAPRACTVTPVYNRSSSRRAPAGLLAAAALAPAAYWLYPALALQTGSHLRDQGDFFFPLKLYTADRLLRGELPALESAVGRRRAVAREPPVGRLLSAGTSLPPSVRRLCAAGLFLLLHFAVAASRDARLPPARKGSPRRPPSPDPRRFAASGFAASLSCYWNHFGAFAWLPALAALARRGLRTPTRPPRLRRAPRASGAVRQPRDLARDVRRVRSLRLALSRRGRRGGFAASLPVAPRAGSAAASGLGSLLAAGGARAVLRARREVGPPRAASRGGAGRRIRRLDRDLLGDRPLSRRRRNVLSRFARGGNAPAAARRPRRSRDRQRRPLVRLLAAVGRRRNPPRGRRSARARGFDRFLRSTGFRYPAKALALTAFSISVLAGLGLDALRFSASARRRGLLVALAAAGLLLVLFSRQPPACRVAEAAGIAAARPARPRPAGTDGPLLGSRSGGRAARRGLARRGGRGTLSLRGGSRGAKSSAEAAFLRAVPGRVLTPAMGALVSYVLRDGTFDAAALRRQRESLLGYTNLLQGIRTVAHGVAARDRGFAEDRRRDRLLSGPAARRGTGERAPPLDAVSPGEHGLANASAISTARRSTRTGPASPSCARFSVEPDARTALGAGRARRRGLAPRPARPRSRRPRRSRAPPERGSSSPASPRTARTRRRRGELRRRGNPRADGRRVPGVEGAGGRTVPPRSFSRTECFAASLFRRDRTESCSSTARSP